MPIFQIKDWDANFENDRSRNRKQCSFVCVPNKQHGMGFCRVVAENDGAAIYGIWHMIVGACSQQKNRNGWLTSDGEQAGSAWLVEDLSLKFRRPVLEIERALEVLCSEKVGWIIRHENTASHHIVTTQSPSTPLEGRKEGREGKEGIGASRFVRPELSTVKLQAAKIGISDVEADHFYSYYESNGWKVGKNPMKSWTHALSNWKINSQNYGKNGSTNTPKSSGRNVGTLNEGKSSQYAGVGRVVPLPTTGQPAT